MTRDPNARLRSGKYFASAAHSAIFSQRDDGYNKTLFERQA